MLWHGENIGAGGNSGFQALNLALLWGAKRVILTGYDMGGGHWHGAHPTGLNNPDSDNFRRWMRIFAANAGDLSGFDVINASRETALECFPRKTIEEIFGDPA